MRKIEILIKEDKDKGISVNMKGYENGITNLKEDSVQNVLLDLVDKFLNDSRSDGMISTEYMKLKLEKEFKNFKRRKRK